ncbi:MAG: hypothetical protein ACYC9R_13095 [Nitrosotalea sp.]
MPKNLSSKFLESIKGGKIDPAKLVEMTSEERRSFFSDIVGADHAKDVNALFESKLLLKDYKKGLVSWAKKVGGLSEPARRDFTTKINKLDRLLNPTEEKAFLSDLAEQKLGTKVTAEEAGKIAQMAKETQIARDAPTKNLSGVSDGYLKSAAEMKAYVASLKPVSAVTSIGKNAAIIARNNLLLNPSTPLKTTVGQIVNSAMDFFTRRIGTFSLKGMNYDLVRQANNEAWKTFRETGLNTASMESLDDNGKLGEGHRFDQPTGMESKNPIVKGIESTVRNIAKISNKVAIDWEHSIAFTKFHQKAFFDMANVFSSNLAKEEGLKGTEAKTRASEIFKDSARIQPKTEEGAIVRAESQKQAARVTSTNDTLTARLSLSVKDGLNKAVVGLGDALMPIAKIPANIIWNGIENAGVGIPLGVKDIFQGRIAMQSEDLAIRYKGMAQFANGIQKVVRTVGVMGAAAYFSSQLTKQDFKTDRYGASYVKIGNTWVNTEYIYAISPALAGMMEVKKIGKPNQGALDTTGQYVAGSLQGLKRSPGVNELTQLVTAITNSNYAKGIQKYGKNFFTSRGVPSFVRQLQNGNTPIKNLFFSTSGLPTQAELKKLGAK